MNYQQPAARTSLRNSLSYVIFYFRNGESIVIMLCTLIWTISFNLEHRKKFAKGLNCMMRFFHYCTEFIAISHESEDLRGLYATDLTV